MPNCCDSRGCDEFFGPRFARRMAKRYRKRGLDKTSRHMVEFLAEHGIEGATVLEVGGGLGEVQIELLKRGAARSVNLELSPAYDGEAGQLLRDAGLEDRVERRLHDIAADPDSIEPVDVVVLHRVVCCDQDFERLLGAAAEAGAEFCAPRAGDSACDSVRSISHPLSRDDPLIETLLRKKGRRSFPAA